MSRSYRKPWVKDTAGREMKHFASRAVRNAKNVPDGMAYKRYFNSYDLCDFRWPVPKPNRNGKQVLDWKWQTYAEMKRDYEKAKRK